MLKSTTHQDLGPAPLCPGRRKRASTFDRTGGMFGLWFLAGWLIATAAPATDDATDPRIALYLSNRLAAVTMTFDDTKPSQLTRAKPLFDEFGYRCTFYVIAGRVGPGQPTTWGQWKAAADQGYEIGNHTYGHWLKGTNSTPELDAWNRQQILGGYEEIAKQIGRPPLTFAFPGGGENDYTRRLVRESPHIDWRNYCHRLKGDRIYPEGDTLTATQAVAYIEKAMAHTKAWNGAELSWFLFYMHDVTEARAQVLRAMLEFIRKHGDQVWCDTYARVTLYERERENSTIAVGRRGAGSLTLSVTNGLDSKIFNVPLTVLMPLPDGARQVSAVRTDNGAPVDVALRERLALVSMAPGGAPVRVEWK